MAALYIVTWNHLDVSVLLAINHRTLILAQIGFGRDWKKFPSVPRKRGASSAGLVFTRKVRPDQKPLNGRCARISLGEMCTTSEGTGCRC